MRRAWGALVVVATTAPAGAASPVAWVDATSSPRPVDETKLAPVERDALARCGAADAGLEATARWIATQRLAGEPMPELDAVAFAQRAAGEPHPWARAWAATGAPLGASAALARLDAWLAADASSRFRRCGAAFVARGGAAALALVVVDALADIAPLPTHARTGQWLTVEARLRVGARGGRVLVLGASGVPRSLPTSFDGHVLRARFAPERVGENDVQVIADLAEGPRPVLEASVFADAPPPASPLEQTAPGELDASRFHADDEALAAMIQGARASVGLPPLLRDGRLDAVARDHARRMALSSWLAHDAGDGDPFDRLRAAGMDPRDAAENVAHAPSVALAHRATWASPSHRANLLRAEMDRMGVGVVRDDRGDVWAAEVFTSGSP